MKKELLAKLYEWEMIQKGYDELGEYLLYLYDENDNGQINQLFETILCLEDEVYAKKYKDVFIPIKEHIKENYSVSNAEAHSIFLENQDDYINLGKEYFERGF